MARKRYQGGSLLKCGRAPNQYWVGRWREDEITAEGTVKRHYRHERLGTLKVLPTERLAQRELDARLNNVNSPEYRPTPTAKLKDFVEEWERVVLSQHERSTVAADRSRLNKHIVPRLGSYCLRDINGQVLQSFLASLNVAPKSAKNVIAVMRMVWNSARAWGYVTHDPFAGLVLPRASRGSAPSFSLDEVLLILESAVEPDRTFYWIAAEAAMRAGELCALKPSCFDLEKMQVTVSESVWRGKEKGTKSGKARTFSISQPLADRLRIFLRGKQGFIFATSNGTPWDQNLVVKRKLHPLLKRLGIQRAGLHAFRHASASLMDRLNAPMKVRQQRLGHSDAQLTMNVYTHADSRDERLVADQLGAMLAPKQIM